MSDAPIPRWTIDELGERVALALSVGYEGPKNGQVRAVPDKRTIRYYNRLGLLDPPLETRGRASIYGPRHLLQLVAIKRLQASGRSLAQVQEALAGLPSERLTALARVPSSVLSEASAASDGAREQRGGRFWAVEPSPPPDGHAVGHPERPTGGGIPSVATYARVTLAPGVALSFEPVRAVDDDDLRALEVASAALVAQLAARGLIEVPGG